MTEEPPAAGHDLSRVVLPSRRGSARRDRRGRGLRGPLLPPTLPGWRTRGERFDETLLSTVERLEKHLGSDLDGVEFAVEEVPPSAPAPWETGAVPLGRYFPADPAAGLSHRIVVYRRPVVGRSADSEDIAALVRDVLVEQLAQMLGRDPEDIDPTYRD
ncbi:metallopeptidase family protein [Occultella gossypii]|uniref:Metallopeptidase family protein n=1 Tax=Occultella gossypii TaxID=2800820 RepID=A0ABS7S7U6_9MICO|nr:metallopeptidase family protein [Occultella gossypii]MBZ2196428.1 metallopeptidase family protein [Occultella gossypii]